MRQSVVAVDFGGPAVLSLVEEPSPVPGEGEVLVSVRAIGVNAVDWKVYSGTMGDDPTQLPMHLGSELSGVVAGLGPGVSAVKLGDEVIAFPAPGAYSTQTAVPVTALTPKPGTLAWPAAAGLMLAGTAAVHLLTATEVTAGETVLIHGAAGGVGLVLIQLAVARGATVIATASEPNHSLLSDLGARPVSYGPGLAERVRALAAPGVDVALDLVGADEAVDTSLELVADRHRIASIAAFGRAPRERIQLLGYGPGADPGVDIRTAARPGLAKMAATGELRILVSETFPLAEAAEAHRRGMTGHTVGKFILLA